MCVSVCVYEHVISHMYKILLSKSGENVEGERHLELSYGFCANLPCKRVLTNDVGKYI